MLQDEILITKFLSTDGLVALGSTREVTTLALKSQNNPVKAVTFINKSLLPSAQARRFSDVLGTLFGNSPKDISPKAYHARLCQRTPWG